MPLSDARLVGHLYGFSAPSDLPRSTPGFCVDITKGACPTVANPLGGAADQRNYTNYQIVKTAFDKLNYGPLANPRLPNPGYTFNPWVELIHADPTKAGNPAYGLNMPCSYAYSVDDAQGNVQAEGRGFILDISSTVNLQNMHPCSPPISISLGYLPNVTPRFYKYAVCKQTDEVLNDRVKPIIPGFASFVIGAQNPATCPIFVWDNVVSGGKNSQPPVPVVEDTDPSGPPLGQMYTFRINGGTTLFPLFTLPKSGKFFPCSPQQRRPDCAPDWSHANHDIIGCMGDVPPKGPNDPTSNPPYSSQIWCCNSAAKAGVYVFSEPVTGAAHKTFNYNASARAAMTCTDKASCNRDNTIGNSMPCNTTF